MSKIAVIGMVGSSAFLPVDRFHTGGETAVAKDFHLEPGGKGYNAAVAAKRFVDATALSQRSKLL